MLRIYAAPWVLPISDPPIENGAVGVEGSTIVRVGPRSALINEFPEAGLKEFGNAAIIPGLINAHSHLELTVMRGFLEAEETNFFAWLRKLTIARMTMTADDLLVSTTCGAIEAARAGVTCLGDSSSSALQSMQALATVGLRGIVYQESFGPDPKLAKENAIKLRDQLAAMRSHGTNLVRAGVSPHAPYTVSAPQLELISQLALDEKLPLMMHAAESAAEASLMLDGSGPFADGLRSRGIEWQAPRISTIQYLKRHGVLATKPLLAHCIHVDDDDLELIKESGAGVAHCPKSNAKLGHGRAPFASFIARKINAGLGSDSVASNNNCDILEEGRFATLLARLDFSGPDFSLRHQPQPETKVGAADTLFAATLGGARALGLDHQIGALREGLQADITIVNLDGAHQNPVTNAAEALIFSSSGRDVVLTMVGGQEVYRDNRLPDLDEADLLARQQSIRIRLDSLAPLSS